MVEKRAGLRVGSQQGLHLSPQFLIVAAEFAKQGYARCGMAFHGPVEDVFDLLPAFGCHADLLVSSSRCSQALADRHSRLIVLGATPTHDLRRLERESGVGG